MARSLGAFLLAGVATLSAALASPVLLVEGGVLTGANGVEVAGSLYDVRFRDGSCDLLYGNCTQFPFSYSDAVLASQALLDQVLHDESLGAFDVHPELVAGCQDAGACDIITLYSYFHGIGYGFGAMNSSAEPLDTVLYGGVQNRLWDSASDASVTMAVWSLHSVPEPGTLALAIGAAGVALMFGAMRRC